MRIAIVGGGISGLVAAHRLGAEHDVTLFEANAYLGGHTNTVDVDEGGREVAVDTGFIVFNDATYPGFCQFLDDLKVPSHPTQMSFSVRDDATNLEYRGMDLRGLFAQPINGLRWNYWRMLADFVRFRKLALRLEDPDEQLTVGEFFQRHRFSDWFIHQYFLPMGSAVWSCPRAVFESFPIQFIIEFYRHHGMLGVQQRPQWRVVTGGSREYVRALRGSWTVTERLGQPVKRLQRLASGIGLETVRGEHHQFDHVVVGCHADQALRLWGDDATPLERELLSAFPYERNEVVLHWDTNLLPRRRAAWACWNYHVRGDEQEKASVTYNMNLLQGLTTRRTYCVTLNDTGRIDPAKVLRTFEYHHPMFQPRRKFFQARHEELIDHQGVSYCGAYWSNGFHEDGLQSALRVSKVLESKAASCPAASTTGGFTT